MNGSDPEGQACLLGERVEQGVHLHLRHLAAERSRTRSVARSTSTGTAGWSTSPRRLRAPGPRCLHARGNLTYDLGTTNADARQVVTPEAETRLRLRTRQRGLSPRSRTGYQLGGRRLGHHLHQSGNAKVRPGDHHHRTRHGQPDDHADAPGSSVTSASPGQTAGGICITDPRQAGVPTCDTETATTTPTRPRSSTHCWVPDPGLRRRTTRGEFRPVTSYAFDNHNNLMCERTPAANAMAG